MCAGLGRPEGILKLEQEVEGGVESAVTTGVEPMLDEQEIGDITCFWGFLSNFRRTKAKGNMGL